MEAAFYLIPIRLADGVSDDAFERFMLDDVFPSVSKEPGRPGRVTGLRLFRGNNSGETGNLGEYLWVVYGAVNGGSARGELDRIRAFGTQAPAEGAKDGAYVEVGRWPADVV